MPRLFAAIELPDDVRDALDGIDMPLPGARWVESDNYHITLRFAGDVDNQIANDFDSALAAIDAPVFSLRLSGLGAFGGADPSSVWAGVEANDAFDSLVRAVERAARGAGLPPAKRAYKPHVTLARLSHSQPEAVARFLGRRGAFRSRPFTVERFVLMSAKPFQGGGPYVVEAEYPLAGSAFRDASPPGWDGADA